MNDAVRELLIDYNMALADEGILGQNHKGVVETPDTPMEMRLEHTRWMVIQLLGTADYFSPIKFNRWLGFIQGVLWMNGNRTLQQLQDENRLIALSEEDDAS